MRPQKVMLTLKTAVSHMDDERVLRCRGRQSTFFACGQKTVGDIYHTAKPREKSSRSHEFPRRSSLDGNSEENWNLEYKYSTKLWRSALSTRVRVPVNSRSNSKTYSNEPGLPAIATSTARCYADAIDLLLSSLPLLSPPPPPPPRVLRKQS